jgi:pimeloyl-ACP methyl ester carboxylesterase
LGTPPSAWPAITGDPDLRVLTWYYRGTAGGSRPADRRRVRIEDHVDDLIALMDAEGVDRAVLVSWSIGVNVAFEAARLHPDRVAGVLAVAGVPGGTFAAMGGSIWLPQRLRHALGVTGARTLRRLGPVLNATRPLVPTARLTALLVRGARIISSEARLEVVEPALEEFLQHDWSWYFELALGAVAHAPMDLDFLPQDLPISFLAGRRDLLTASRNVLTAARQVPHADVRVLPGSHFLPLEHPHELRRALADLLVRSDLTDPVDDLVEQGTA